MRELGDRAAHEVATAATAAVEARREAERAVIVEQRLEDAAVVAAERATSETVLAGYDDGGLAERMRAVTARAQRLHEARQRARHDWRPEDE